MAVSAINNTNGSTLNNTTTNTTNAATSAVNRTIMNKDDYLKLFLASLQYQDPSAPMEQKDMMQQMSMLSEMEAIQNLTTTVNDLKTSMGTSGVDKGTGYLGKEVEGTTSDGEKVDGIVNEVALNDGKVNVVVNNKNIEIGSITRVLNNSALLAYQNNQAS